MPRGVPDPAEAKGNPAETVLAFKEPIASSINALAFSCLCRCTRSIKSDCKGSSGKIGGMRGAIAKAAEPT